MKFFINELSFQRQAENQYEADQLIEELYKIIEAVQPMQGNYPLQTHSSLSYQLISSSLTLNQWLFHKLKSSDSREKKLSEILLIFLKKGPFIDTQGLLDNCQCYFNSQDVSSSSLTGAANDDGILISLKKAINFESESISVRFRKNQEDFQDIDIKNLTDVTQANQIRRYYVPSDKHKKGGWGTYMDLTYEEAQQALDRGVPHGKQIYSYYNSKHYEFQPDNAGGFHGYPIDAKNVPPKVIRILGESQ